MSNPSEVKKLFEYLPEIIKFHRLKNEGLARLIFVLVLFFQLLGDYLQYKFMHMISFDNVEILFSAISTGVVSSELTQSPEYIMSILFMLIGTILIVKLVSNLIISVYMYSYILELKGKDSGFKASFSGTFRHLGRLIAFNIIFGLLVLIGSMFFIVPGIIAYAVYVFGYCYILDLKLNISDAMTASNDISRNRKTQIINLFVGFLLMFKLPIFLFISGSSLGSAFLASFFGTISSLILQRLICQIYVAFEYKKQIAKK